MRANFELFDFELGGSDMDAISASTEANPGEPALTPTSSTASPTKLHLAGTEKWCCPERRLGAIRDDIAHRKCQADGMDMAAAKALRTDLS